MTELKTARSIIYQIFPNYYERSGNPLAYLIAVNQPTINQDIEVLKNWGFTAFKRLIGCDGGKLENVYLIVTDENHVKMAAFLKANKQDYAIFLDNQRTAYKILPESDNKKPEVIGRLHEVPEDYIRNQKAWTYDPLTGTYFFIY